MLKEKTDFDTLGAEALPGGLAEILRTLQPALEPALPAPQIPEGRGIRRFFARRKKQQNVGA
jgi:hypothetical protein